MVSSATSSDGDDPLAPHFLSSHQNSRFRAYTQVLALLDSSKSRDALATRLRGCDSALAKYIQASLTSVLPRGIDTVELVVCGSAQARPQQDETGGTSIVKDAKLVIAMAARPDGCPESLQNESTKYRSGVTVVKHPEPARDTSKEDSVVRVLINETHAHISNNPKATNIPFAQHAQFYVRLLRHAHATNSKKAIADLYDYVYVACLPKMLARIQLGRRCARGDIFNFWDVLTAHPKSLVAHAYSIPMPQPPNSTLPSLRQREVLTYYHLDTAKPLYNEPFDRLRLQQLLRKALMKVQDTLEALQDAWNDAVAVGLTTGDSSLKEKNLECLVGAISRAQRWVRQLDALIKSFREQLDPHLHWLAESAHVFHGKDRLDWTPLPKSDCSSGGSDDHLPGFESSSFTSRRTGSVDDKQENVVVDQRESVDLDSEDELALAELEEENPGTHYPNDALPQDSRSMWVRDAIKYLRLIGVHERGLKRATRGVASSGTTKAMRIQSHFIQSCSVSVVENNDAVKARRLEAEKVVLKEEEGDFDFEFDDSSDDGEPFTEVKLSAIRSRTMDVSARPYRR